MCAELKKYVILQREKQWGFSSSGRALGSQSKGGRFESGILHRVNKLQKWDVKRHPILFF